MSTEQGRDRLAALESDRGGRLGVQVLDTGTGLGFGWRQTERFGLCSTFKLPLAALVLREHAAGRLDGLAGIDLHALPPVPHMPVLAEALKAGRRQMSALELAHATQTTSDNLAANLLLSLFGGPQGFTEKIREIADTDFRVDRWETEMNLVPVGEERDTVSPRGMAHLCARLLGPGVLDPGSRRILEHWMIETRTGRMRIRAGLPCDWRAGDKTGTGIAPTMPNKHNDVAIVWPPGRPPLLVAAYYEADGHHPDPRARDDAVLAEVGRLVAEWVS